MNQEEHTTFIFHSVGSDLRWPLEGWWTSGELWRLPGVFSEEFSQDCVLNPDKEICLGNVSLCKVQVASWKTLWQLESLVQTQTTAGSNNNSNKGKVLSLDPGANDDKDHSPLLFLPSSSSGAGSFSWRLHTMTQQQLLQPRAR